MSKSQAVETEVVRSSIEQEAAPKPPPPIPMHLSELKQHHVTQLVEMAVANGIEGANRMRKQDLIFAMLKNTAKKGESIFGDGTLEVLPDGFGFLRSPETSYLASTDDIYVSPSQIRRFNLHTGDSIEGEIRTPKDGERYFALVKVDKVNADAPEASKHKILFENLTPLHPDEHLKLERDMKGEENITSRIIDIIAPIGKGQRGLIVSPPKAGKTVLMQQLAHAITSNHPDVIAWASCCISTVLPALGGETMRPRCPLPIGAMMSMMRLVMFSSPFMSRSSLRVLSGCSGVRFSNRILCLEASGASALTLST